MVEFAIVAPLMFMLIFAGLEFIRFGMLQSLAHDAAYEAARHVMVPGSLQSEGVAEANRILGYLGTQDAIITIESYAKDGSSQTEIDDGTTAVEVEIEVPMTRNAFVLSAFTKDKTIRASARLGFESYTGYYDGGN